MATWLIALIILSALVVACLFLYVIFEVFNGPDGERYQKLGIQGPFVPASEVESQAEGASSSVQARSEHGDG